MNNKRKKKKRKVEVENTRKFRVKGMKQTSEAGLRDSELALLPVVWCGAGLHFSRPGSSTVQ
jgi:hypothetical protein